MSSLVTVYGDLGSLTGGSWTGTGGGSSVGVAGASSAGSRSRGSEFGLSGVFLYAVMHQAGARSRPRQRLRFRLGPAATGLNTGSFFVTLSSAASRTDNFT